MADNYSAATKVFCDGSWSSTTKIGSFAAITIKDGVITQCEAGVIRNCSPGLETELAGLNAGCRLAEQAHTNEALIHSDCIEAIRVLWSCVPGPESAKKDVAEITTKLHRHPFWSVLHIAPAENGEADALATWARMEESVWVRKDAILRFLTGVSKKWVPAIQLQQSISGSEDVVVIMHGFFHNGCELHSQECSSGWNRTGTKRRFCTRAPEYHHQNQSHGARAAEFSSALFYFPA